MKNNYTLLWLLSLLSFSFINAQECPETLGISSSDILVHFNINPDTCTDYPGAITIEGRSFDKKSCSGTDLKYELMSGAPLPLYDTFSVDLGFGLCEYAAGELRRETLTVEQFTSGIHTLKIYPNPLVSGDKINVNFSNNLTAKINMFDLTGKLVMQDEISSSSTKQLNISTLNNGVYLLQIAADNSTTSRKIVIMR